MRKFKLVIAILLIPAFVFAGGEKRSKVHKYTNEKPYQVEEIKFDKSKKVKNVILMIGDGMSLMHMYSAWTCNKGKLYIENCDAVGLSKTYCANKLITDSGAGGTAMATGQKTNYHSIGVDTNGNPLKSLTDLAQEKHLGTGIAVSCRLWDATPAAFCAKNIDRDAEEDIIADYAKCGVDYIFGGGAKLFEERKDKRNIFNEMKSKGYTISRTWEDLEKQESTKICAVVRPNDLPEPKERGDLLLRGSLKGIELLSKNKNGFFMMIEGSQLDDYGHSNELDLLMQEVLDFDQTIGGVLKWASQNGETLVIVTADHETGGLTLIGGDKDKGAIECAFSTTSHSGVMVPVYAFGPGSENFTGIYENTAIFDKIKTILDL